jgi:hypothetical protein
MVTASESSLILGYYSEAMRKFLEAAIFILFLKESYHMGSTSVFVA